MENQPPFRSTTSSLTLPSYHSHYGDSNHELNGEGGTSPFWETSSPIDESKDCEVDEPPFEADPKDHKQGSPSFTEKKNFSLANADQSTIQKIREVLGKEFDKEIEHRKQELATIEERIKETENLIDKMADCTGYNPYYTEKSDQSMDPKTRSGKKSSGTVRTGSDLFAQTADGVFIKLSCPSCNRTKFLNKLGFVNHCRIRHKLKFSSYEDASMHCGTPVDESEVPLDDAARKERMSFRQDELYKKKVTETIPKAPPKPIIKQEEVEEKELPESPYSSPVQSVPIEEENISRFYVRKRIVVGNTSKHIRKEQREADDLATHKWMVYVRGSEDEPDISSFVKKVRFFLDPSFKPNDVIDVVHSPFQITRRGWGEFPVRVQIHFVDPKNKPVNIIHVLKLDTTLSGLQTLGAETPVDVELDREFFELRGILPKVGPNGDNAT